jgi:hypothetical protein
VNWLDRATRSWRDAAGDEIEPGLDRDQDLGGSCGGHYRENADLRARAVPVVAASPDDAWQLGFELNSGLGSCPRLCPGRCSWALFGAESKPDGLPFQGANASSGPQMGRTRRGYRFP